MTQARQIQRFFDYFEEAAQERDRPVTRNRRLVLFVYISDNSVSIIEPRAPNSDIIKGEFMMHFENTSANAPASAPATSVSPPYSYKLISRTALTLISNV